MPTPLLWSAWIVAILDTYALSLSFVLWLPVSSRPAAIGNSLPMPTASCLIGARFYCTASHSLFVLCSLSGPAAIRLQEGPSWSDRYTRERGRCSLTGEKAPFGIYLPKQRSPQGISSLLLLVQHVKPHGLSSLPNRTELYFCTLTG